MSLTVKREFIANNAGQKIVLDANEIKQETSLEFVCDSPRHDARGLTKDPVSWIEEEAVADINSLPDSFFTILKLQPYPTDVNAQYYFCSPGCRPISPVEVPYTLSQRLLRMSRRVLHYVTALLDSVSSHRQLASFRAGAGCRSNAVPGFDKSTASRCL